MIQQIDNSNIIKEYLKTIDEVIARGSFKDNWESLKAFKIPEWLKKGRFGLFIHWGAYSVPEADNEWYPRNMYRKGTAACRHKTAVYGADMDYRKIVMKFNPDCFDAEEWLKLFSESGARYIMPVGEHHDGVKMYKSELNRWNTVNLPPKRDFLAELHAACDKFGLGFLTSSHRAEHYWFLNPARRYYPSSEISKNEYPDLYGPAAVTKSGRCDRNDTLTVPTEWLEDWLVSSCEEIDRNKPLAFYFDWWVRTPAFTPYLKKFLAYYYNRGEEWGKEVAVFLKLDAAPRGVAVFDVERGQINKPAEELWQNDTSISRNSWGYTTNNIVKPTSEIIANMIEVIAKNGCYMLNVGPKANGEICEAEKKVLKEIGAWLRQNGEGIYDVKPFANGSEGCKHTLSGHGERKVRRRNNEYRFTASDTGNAVYVFPLKCGLRYTFKIKLLGSDAFKKSILSVSILGIDKKISFIQNKDFLLVNVDGGIDTKLPICLKVSTK